MRMLKWAALGAALFFAGSAQAQVVGIGTTAGGAMAQIGASVASVVSAHSGLQMRPQKMSGTQQYIVAVNEGRIEFGGSNIMQYYMAVSGTGLAEGKPNKNLRIVATLMPFIQGVLVRKDSGINSIADLKGKRIPAGYSSSPLFETFWQGFLANSGLSYDDVSGVPVASLPKSWAAFKEGQTDAAIAAAGSAPVREMDAVISGGVKYLPLTASDQLFKDLPKTRIEKVEPGEAMNGIVEPTDLHVYEVVLFANADVPEDVIYKVTKALAENEKELRASGPLWKTYRPQNIAMDHGLEYHPGAVKYYKENNLWSR